MINLLFVLPWFGIGGSEHVVLELARGLDKSRFRPIIFAIKPGPMEATFKAEGLKTLVSKKQSGHGHLQLTAQINNIIKAYAIDIVLPHHMTSLFYVFFPARLLNRTRLYFTEHSALGIRSVPSYLKLAAMIFLFFSSGCIAISREIGRAYSDSMKVRPSKVIHIPNGIDIRRFHRSVHNIATRASLGIRPDEIVIGTVANMKEVKNHKNLLVAFHKLRKKLDNVTLVLVGGGPLEDSLKALTNDLGISDKVKFMGRRTDGSKFYHIFDIFCLSSFAEGFPLSVLEAMACRLPVVATDVSGINEIIESGQNGILVKSNDAADLANAILMLIHDNTLRNYIRQNGFVTIMTKFSYTNWIQEYEWLFSKTAKNGHI